MRRSFMTKLDEFFAKEGDVKILHENLYIPDAIKEKMKDTASKDLSQQDKGLMPNQEKMNDMASENLPQWVKDLMPNQEKDALIKGFVDGRMTALSIGKKDMLDSFAAKYGFNYDTSKSNIMINNMNRSRDR